MGHILYMSTFIKISSSPQWRCITISWPGVLMSGRIPNCFAVSWICMNLGMNPLYSLHIDAIGHTARCAYSAIRQQYSSPNGRTCCLQKSSVIWWVLISVAMSSFLLTIFPGWECTHFTLFCRRSLRSMAPRRCWSIFNSRYRCLATSSWDAGWEMWWKMVF